MSASGPPERRPGARGRAAAGAPAGEHQGVRRRGGGQCGAWAVGHGGAPAGAAASGAVGSVLSVTPPPLPSFLLLVLHLSPGSWLRARPPICPSSSSLAPPPPVDTTGRTRRQCAPGPPRRPLQPGLALTRGVWGSGASFSADPCAERLWHQPLHHKGQPGSPPALESPEHGGQPLPLTGRAQHAPQARGWDAGGIHAARAVGVSPSRSVPVGDLSSGSAPAPL